eukprot:TRINITY_DN1649_c1_g2_i2.p1 TRINITY_DN1649_c1_g2~~TRINITY_DN1649_c1_g2_i2.p1  ORF type:complete len:339 (+),score=57.05 TRINITY_DN1649_c1_g2_i2:390-1406(+)
MNIVQLAFSGACCEGVYVSAAADALQKNGKVTRGRFPSRLSSDSDFVGRKVKATSSHPTGSRQLRTQRQAVICQAVAATDKKSARAPRQENVAGEFFVDHTCIDCDTCRWMAPEVFSRIGDMSAVHQQPKGETDRLKALQALLSCPTASIHTAQPTKDILSTHATFPLPIDQVSLPGVYHCGYHSPKSYGAASYFIQRPEGNILVDSPRYTERLAQRLEALGGVQYMFLSHRDDIADHAQWARRFGCQRILHEAELQPSTKDVEMVLYDDGKWDLGSDVELIFTPGHTEGCVCLFMPARSVLFTGDHLALDEDSPDRCTIMSQYNRNGGTGLDWTVLD